MEFLSRVGENQFSLESMLTQTHSTESILSVIALVLFFPKPKCCLYLWDCLDVCSSQPKNVRVGWEKAVTKSYAKIFRPPQQSTQPSSMESSVISATLGPSMFPCLLYLLPCLGLCLEKCCPFLHKSSFMFEIGEPLGNPMLVCLAATEGLLGSVGHCRGRKHRGAVELASG